MQLIVDASVLVAELLRRAGRERIGHRALELLLTEHTFSESQHELRKRISHLSQQHSLLPDESNALLEACLEAIRSNLRIVPHAAYAPLETEARWRIARDPNDWPCIALALALNCGIWTMDQDFFGCGLATWTTPTLSAWLEHHPQPEHP